MADWYDAADLQELDGLIVDALEAEAMVSTEDTGLELGSNHVTLRATWTMDGGDD